MVVFEARLMRVTYWVARKNRLNALLKDSSTDARLFWVDVEDVDVALEEIRVNWIEPPVVLQPAIRQRRIVYVPEVYSGPM